MNVLFVLAGDETRASTRFRVLNLLPSLDRSAIDFGTLSAKKFSKRLPGPDSIGYVPVLCELMVRAPQYDIVFLQRVPLPSLYLTVLERLCDHIIYDFDDALYTAPQWEDRDNQWKSMLDDTLQHSSQVIAGSPTLAEYARQHSDRVVCLPTLLPVETYRNRQQRSYSGTTEPVVLGWIGNPQNLQYLESIEEPIAELLDRNGNVEFHVITAGELPVTPLREHPDVTYRTWTLENELELLSSVDIGLRPLFDDEWTRAKGGYTSVVQMMALGIPVVVTPVGTLAEIVTHGEVGYHARSDDDWIQYVSALIDDDELRTEFGDAAYEAVGEQRFWTEQRSDDWVDIFEQLG